MSSQLTKGLNNLMKKLSKIADPDSIQNVVIETTFNANEKITEKITNDIRPHSGLSRKRNPQTTVTDLVDTGAYRASWLPSFPSRFEGRLATNSSYALPLEEGTENRKGFFVARTVAETSKIFFIKTAQKAIREALK